MDILKTGVNALAGAGVALALVLTATHAVPAQSQGQTASTYRAPRTYDKRPNLNGIWQANNTAHWNLEPHSVAGPPVVALGAQGGIPAGQGVIEGGTIPYLPAALKQRDQNRANRLKLDPEVQCFLPGIPRATYMPFPFQIVQSPDWILMAYEYAGATRTINMDGKQPDMPVDTWMGYSWGRWDGESLVVETKGFNDSTWLDRSGNFHSDQLHVVERFTPRSPDVLMYEATLTDPGVYSRPWKISMPLYKRAEANAQILEYNCVPMTEELRFGPLVDAARQSK
jgi:hypothetical protein